MIYNISYIGLNSLVFPQTGYAFVSANSFTGDYNGQTMKSTITLNSDGTVNFSLIPSTLNYFFDGCNTLTIYGSSGSGNLILTNFNSTCIPISAPYSKSWLFNSGTDNLLLKLLNDGNFQVANTTYSVGLDGVITSGATGDDPLSKALKAAGGTTAYRINDNLSSINKFQIPTINTVQVYVTDTKINIISVLPPSPSPQILQSLDNTWQYNSIYPGIVLFKNTSTSFVIVGIKYSAIIDFIDNKDGTFSWTSSASITSLGIPGITGETSGKGTYTSNSDSITLILNDQNKIFFNSTNPLLNPKSLPSDTYFGKVLNDKYRDNFKTTSDNKIIMSYAGQSGGQCDDPYGGPSANQGCSNNSIYTYSDDGKGTLTNIQYQSSYYQGNSHAFTNDTATEFFSDFGLPIPTSISYTPTTGGIKNATSINMLPNSAYTFATGGWVFN
jgi:hypothetical protein